MNFSNNNEIADILSNIVNFSDDAIISKTLEGVITSWNRGAQKVFGYSSEEVIGKHVSILIPPGRYDEEPMIIEKVKQSEHVDHYETERITKDRSIIIISLTVLPIKNAQGNIIGILKIARDITIKKKSEEIQSRMAGIINLSDDAIITQTLEGTITSWNRGAENIFGYSNDEVIGKPIALLIPPGKLNEEPAIAEQIKQGKYVAHYETERLKKDGTIVDISLTVSAIRDGNKNITGVLKISRDISERKKIEQIQLRLAAIVNNSNDAIVSKNLDGIITSWNAGAERIFGYTTDEAVGQSIMILIPKDKTHEEHEILSKIRNGEAVNNYETQRRRKDGSLVDISVTISPIKDSTGQVIGASKIAHNISERKKKEEQILLLNKELESFSFSVSHELKAPLRIINNYAQILIEDYQDTLDGPKRKVVDVISRNSKRMTQLIDDLQEYSQLVQQDLIKSNVDMEVLVKNLLREQITRSSSKSSIQVNTLYPCYADRSLMKKVLINLIDNAVKYSRQHPEPQIEIGSVQTPEAVTYYVKDNGVGFDMRYADKLFQVFQKLHKTSDFEGTGVGLAIVNRIIFKHGGHTWAEAMPDQGATFFFSIPIHRSNTQS